MGGAKVGPTAARMGGTKVGPAENPVGPPSNASISRTSSCWAPRATPVFPFLSLRFIFSRSACGSVSNCSVCERASSGNRHSPHHMRMHSWPSYDRQRTRSEAATLLRPDFRPTSQWDPKPFTRRREPHAHRTTTPKGQTRGRTVVAHEAPARRKSHSHKPTTRNVEFQHCLQSRHIPFTACAGGEQVPRCQAPLWLRLSIEIGPAVTATACHVGEGPRAQSQGHQRHHAASSYTMSSGDPIRTPRLLSCRDRRRRRLRMRPPHQQMHCWTPCWSERRLRRLPRGI